MDEYLQTTTQKTLSRFDVLTEVMRLNSFGEQADFDGSQAEVEESLRTTWLPIFKNKANLSFALEAIITTCDDEQMARLCSFNLAVLRGLNED